jgi:hypothetical protein
MTTNTTQSRYVEDFFNRLPIMKQIFAYKMLTENNLRYLDWEDREEKLAKATHSLPAELDHLDKTIIEMCEHFATIKQTEDLTNGTTDNSVHFAWIDKEKAQQELNNKKHLEEEAYNTYEATKIPNELFDTTN